MEDGLNRGGVHSEDDTHIKAVYMWRMAGMEVVYMWRMAGIEVVYMWRMV